MRKVQRHGKNIFKMYFVRSFPSPQHFPFALLKPSQCDDAAHFCFHSLMVHIHRTPISSHKLYPSEFTWKIRRNSFCLLLFQWSTASIRSGLYIFKQELVLCESRWRNSGGVFWRLEKTYHFYWSTSGTVCEMAFQITNHVCISCFCGGLLNNSFLKSKHRQQRVDGEVMSNENGMGAYELRTTDQIERRCDGNTEPLNFI